ncbi:MAG: arsenate reductase [Flavobacteriaceae bacterium]|nr:arsenate reductase [Flavobacteriaceae bacterium]
MELKFKSSFLLHNPGCRKSREALNYLHNLNIDFEIILYLKENLKLDFLKSIIKKINIDPIDMIRTQEKIWINEYKSKKLDRNQILEILIKHPKLMKRPVFIKNNKGVIAIPHTEIDKII